MSRWHKHEWAMLPLQAFCPRAGGGMTLEGDKGSDVPEPPPELVEAQVKSLGVQDTAIQQIMANTTEMAPLQKEQTQFALDTARTAWQQSQSDRDYSLERRGVLTGLQDQMAQDARDFNQEDRAAQLAGQAGADVSQAYASAQRTQAAEMARMGVNPADGKYGAQSNALTAGTALATAQASNNARTQARAEGQALTDRAANALAGYPTMGMQTTAATAAHGASGQAIANTGLAGLNAGLGQASSSAAAMGNSASGMMNAQSNWHSSQQKTGESLGGILGGAGGLVTGLAQAGVFSDRRLKTDVRKVGADKATGLALYEFAYTDDPARRFRGVMADEVQERFPDAVATNEQGFMSVDYTALGIQFQEVK